MKVLREHFKKVEKYKFLHILLAFVAGFLVVFLLLSGIQAIDRAQQDKQCTTHHKTSTEPPHALMSANDYFTAGNYFYDLGNCKQAITDYTVAIRQNPNFAEAYNNRAYTYMRMRDYANALPDLDRAISLRPTYVNALMNRGDIYNFYYHIDRAQAISDYDRAIATGQTQHTNVCGHRILAASGGWSPIAVGVIIRAMGLHNVPGC